MAESGGVKSIVKALNIIEELAKNGPMSISALSANLDMDKATVHRIVNTVREEGFITQDPKSKKYENGIKLFEIGQGVIDKIGLNTIARPYIESLANATGESVSLALIKEDKIVIIDKIESNSTIRVGINIGAALPIYCTGLGKAVLANISEEERSEILKNMKFEPLTENTLTSCGALMPHLEEIKEQGYSMDNEEYVRGLICFGAPIFDHRRGAVAAVSISLPSLRYRTEYKAEYPELVKGAATEISRHIGGR